ncbi:MAG: ATP phosphoribosyltransferase regulatory subunit [Nitratiruptor sp.]|nr:ATP phosphoribosyltransferase regulatory subunit [Nitratiruptor sp.]NPA83846.1 ATP phosphoribosyltransferase regulatory subunit [Campylobacterota bacterium]
MVYEHEIPKGARLYFGPTARLKRQIEEVASSILYEAGFEEILTPLFSYHQHRYFESEQELIRLSDELNQTLTIRADSTIDVVRLITNRLGRSTEHRKWFYIQPVYRYPTREYYQIGAEWLGSRDVATLLKVVLQILQALEIPATLQLSNIKIPLLLSRHYGLPLEIFRKVDLDRILNQKPEWIGELVYLDDPHQIDGLLDHVPEEIAKELIKLQELSRTIHHRPLVIAPLYYAKMRYYRELFFRLFIGNETIAMGGAYGAQGVEACGFAIYTDAIIERLKGGV